MVGSASSYILYLPSAHTGALLALFIPVSGITIHRGAQAPDPWFILDFSLSPSPHTQFISSSFDSTSRSYPDSVCCSHLPATVRSGPLPPVQSPCFHSCFTHPPVRSFPTSVVSCHCKMCVSSQYRASLLETQVPHWCCQSALRFCHARL